MAAAVDLQGVTLARGRKNVLTNVTFSLDSCEFVGMLGPNGAGKTTLIQALLGLVPASHGEVRVFGAVPARGNPAIGYMPQSRAAAASLRLSGFDFVAGVVKGHRWGLPLLHRHDRREIAWALDMVGAAELARHPLSEISGGQRQRLLLAQALIGRPKLLLLDEPLMSLDPHHQQDVVALIRSIQRDLRITVLFSAHELNPLVGSLDRVLYLGGGQAALGTVDEVVNGPSLSRLYGSAIDVLHVHGRIFVMSGDCEMERDEHRHDHTGHGRHASHV